MTCRTYTTEELRAFVERRLAAQDALVDVLEAGKRLDPNKAAICDAAAQAGACSADISAAWRHGQNIAFQRRAQNHD